jgi:hypothetical protein
MLQDFNLLVNPCWHKHKPNIPVMISNKVTLTYDMTQEVDYVVETNMPGIVLLDEEERNTLLIDVTIHMNINAVKNSSI